MSTLTAPRPSAMLAVSLKETPMRLSKLSADFLRFYQARGSSPHTITSYDLSVRQYLAHLASIGLVDDTKHFAPDTVSSFARDLAEKGLSPTSVNLKLSALRSLGEYGIKTKDSKGRYILAENPLTRVYRPKRTKPPAKYLYADELARLHRVQAPAPQRLALWLLIDTALRVSEVAEANIEHLTQDGDRFLLAVKVKGSRYRTITLGADLGAALVASLRLREAELKDPLVVNDHGARYTRTSLSELVRRLAVKAAITRIVVRAHTLRHSVATRALALGADLATVAAMLNHSGLGAVHHYVHRHDSVDDARERVRAELARAIPPGQ